MSQVSPAAGVTSGRQPAEVIADNFSDLHPALTPHEALVAADRCYFCHDAPCITACPTSIDIPLFIRQIATGTEDAAAKTIFDQNILGGMCARVCPTETLCEQACVREAAEGKPVEIGRLQRFATDSVMDAPHPYTRQPETDKTVAVVGAGPAGLACAHRLAMYGHRVTLFDARAKAGGLNEYGIAAYKATGDFAQDELDWLLAIGGITVETGKALGADLTLATLQADHDAVFLGFGLGGVNALSLDGAHSNALDAVDWIAEMRQSADKQDVPVGRDVVVIGGGMTAVDAAVQAKLLGAETVTIAYRKGRDGMSASRYEQDLATSKGVRLLFHATPQALTDGAITFTRTGTDEAFTLPADQVMRAIGQTLDGTPDGIALDGKKIKTDAVGRTSQDGVWAGGDCASGGEDLTVTAVAQGRDAAEDIHASLMGGA
ncbi:MAG: NAD(P)-dependent oxidoreductase [Pseudomonadota bacterium]